MVRELDDGRMAGAEPHDHDLEPFHVVEQNRRAHERLEILCVTDVPRVHDDETADEVVLCAHALSRGCGLISSGSTQLGITTIRSRGPPRDERVLIVSPIDTITAGDRRTREATATAHASCSKDGGVAARSGRTRGAASAARQAGTAPRTVRRSSTQDRRPEPSARTTRDVDVSGIALRLIERPGNAPSCLPEKVERHGSVARLGEDPEPQQEGDAGGIERR